MKAGAADERRCRCVVCAKTDELHMHHVAGKAHLPDVVVPVCQTRHAAWHRRLCAAGVNLRPAAGAEGLYGWVTAIVVGFDSVLEDGAALAEDPVTARAASRQRQVESLKLLGHYVPGGPPQPYVAPPSVRSASGARQLGDGPRGCLPRTPTTAGERRRRSEALCEWLLELIAALLDAILPGELAGLHLAERLRSIEPQRLVAAALAGSEAMSGGSAAHRSLDGLGLGEQPTLSYLGAALDSLVAQLETMAMRA